MTALLRLGLPMSVQAMLSALVLLIDVFFVARIGTDAVSAVGLIAGLTTFLGVLVNGAGIAITTIVANSWSSGDPDAKSQALVQGMLAILGLSIVLPILGLLAYEPFLWFMSARPDLVELGRPYAFWVILGFPGVISLYLLNCIVRGAGQPRYALDALLIACIVNVALNPLLIFGLGPVPAFGLAGAGAATVLGRIAGSLYQFRTIFSPRHDAFPRPDFSRVSQAARNMRRLLGMTATATVQTLIGIASSLFVLGYVASFDSVVLAGYVVGTRIIALAMLPIIGLATAACVLAGQNVSVEQRPYARATIRASFAVGCLVALALAVSLGTISGAFLTPFDLAEGAVAPARTYLLVTAVFLLPYATGNIAFFVANGLGMMRNVVWVQLTALLAVQLPATLIMVEWMGLGAAAVWVATGLSYLVWVAGGLFLLRHHLAQAPGTPRPA